MVPFPYIRGAIETMAYIIGQRCLGEQYADCVAVCPVNCIWPGDYEGQPFMIIDPDVCISCGLCMPECPIDAIMASEDEDPTYAQINRDLTPAWKEHAAVTPRDSKEPPRRPDNVNRFL